MNVSLNGSSKDGLIACPKAPESRKTVHLYFGITMSTKADTLWVGLLTEAGEVTWPGYKRIPVGAERPAIAKFKLALDEPAELNVFNLIGMYSSETGGRCVRIVEVTHPANPMANNDDTIAFSIQ